MPGVEILSAPKHDVFYKTPIQQQLIFQNQISKNVQKIPYIPPEIILIILKLLKDDKKTLAACALVNHTFKLHVTPILYHSVSFSLPFSFTLFANTINSETQRSRLIRRLDLSGFSTMGLQKSESDVASKKIITPEVLISILRFCTMLETFSISEYLESLITFEVLQTLLFECKNIKTLDFCGFSNKRCGSAFVSLAEKLGQVKCSLDYRNDLQTFSFQKSDNAKLPHLKRLSLHECPSIPESSIITLLSHSPNLTHLDLGGCSISDLTLNFLETETNAPQTLTHLLLAKCKNINISSEQVADLVAKCERLEVLNLYDMSTAISEYDLTTILTSPSAKSFKTLNVGSSRITQTTLYNIQENCINLQHLGIAKAHIRTISCLVDFLNETSNIEYVDLTDVSCLSSLNIAKLLNDLRDDHSLHTIEINGSLFKSLGTINEWKTVENYSRRRWYYSKEVSGERPDKVHPRKLDVTESGSERMSKIFDYYSFSV